MKREIVYNTLQAELNEAIINWDPSRAKPLVVTGEGGTGKTLTIMRSIVELLLLAEGNVRPLILAPTHQAVRVLKNKFFNSATELGLEPQVAARVAFSTVSSALSKFGFTAADGGLGFRRNGEFSNKLLNANLIYIDEVSMVSAGDIVLVECLLAASAGAGGEAVSRRIILSGDPHQLTPVMDTASCILDQSDVHLVEQMRAADASAVLAMCEELRKEDSWWLAVRRDGASGSAGSDGVVLYENQEDLVNCLVMDLPSMDESFAYLTYTNKDAQQVGDKIREALYGDEASEETFVEGELLSLKSPLEFCGFVSDTIRVDRVIGYNSEGLSGANLRFAVLTVTGPNGTTTASFMTLGSCRALPGVVAGLQSRLREAREAKDKPAQAALLNSIIELREQFMVWTYPYSRTIHSSQGQTIDHVYLDAGQVCGASNQQKLFYVAVSRTAKRLHFVPTEPEWVPGKHRTLVRKNEWSTVVNNWRSKFAQTNQNNRFLPYSVNGNAQRILILKILKNDLEAYETPEEFNDKVIKPLKVIKKDWNRSVLPIFKTNPDRILWEELQQAGVDPSDLKALDDFMFGLLA